MTTTSTPNATAPLARHHPPSCKPFFVTCQAGPQLHNAASGTMRST
ncbi:hypothetical protein [Pseudomonas sp. UBA2684]|nr:hypothetical protein [Pseudomonas sp. UBA2684]